MPRRSAIASANEVDYHTTGVNYASPRARGVRLVTSMRDTSIYPLSRLSSVATTQIRTSLAVNSNAATRFDHKEDIVMKQSYLMCTLFAIFGTFCAASNASAEGLTRAQVRADLVRLEQAGYSPGHGDDFNYPADIQAAEGRVAAADGASKWAGAGAGTSVSQSSVTSPLPAPSSALQ